MLAAKTMFNPATASLKYFAVCTDMYKNYVNLNSKY